MIIVDGVERTIADKGWQAVTVEDVSLLLRQNRALNETNKKLAGMVNDRDEKIRGLEEKVGLLEKWEKASKGITAEEYKMGMLILERMFSDGEDEEEEWDS
jgi:hypothetical protein